MMYVETGSSKQHRDEAAFCDLICRRVQDNQPTEKDLDILRAVLAGDGLCEGDVLTSLDLFQQALQEGEWEELHRKEFAYLFSIFVDARSLPEVIELALAMSVNEQHFDIETTMTIRPKSPAKRALGIRAPMTISHDGQFDSRFGGSYLGGDG